MPDERRLRRPAALTGTCVPPTASGFDSAGAALQSLHAPVHRTGPADKPAWTSPPEMFTLWVIITENLSILKFFQKAVSGFVVVKRYIDRTPFRRAA